MNAVREHISHGDYEATRYVDTDLSVESVTEMLNSCSYLKLPEFSDDPSIVLQSRTMQEVLDQRAADAERVARELADTGVSQIGWVEYRVLRRAHAPILHSIGWDTDRINRCFA